MAIANGMCVSFCNQPRHIIWLPHEAWRTLWHQDNSAPRHFGTGAEVSETLRHRHHETPRNSVL